MERVPRTQEARSAVDGCCRQLVWRIFLPERCVGNARAESNERMECIGTNELKGCMYAVVKRCGVKRNTAATTWICRVGKDIYPESEMSGMERNERMNDSSCVRLAIAV